jgi:hypothetical protein
MNECEAHYFPPFAYRGKCPKPATLKHAGFWLCDDCYDDLCAFCRNNSVHNIDDGLDEL